MSDLIVLTDTTYLGALLALLVFGGLRFLDDIVDVLVSVEDRPLTDPPKESGSSR